MMVVVSYDVATTTASGRRRLRRVAKVCSNYGQRAQNSVFHCVVDPDLWTFVRTELLAIIDPEEDSLRFYFLGKNWKKRIEHHGAKATVALDGPLIA